ncbi:MAG: hypothetical protein B7Z80_09230, partial [Rhodospirillales bacterium 20-64-7]
MLPLPALVVIAGPLPAGNELGCASEKRLKAELNVRQVAPLCATGRRRLGVRAGPEHHANGKQKAAPMKLKDQVALITGGSRGIGRATALLFAQEGADIAFCHLQDDAQAEITAAEIRALGRRAMHRSVDVADIAATRAFAQAVTAAFGPIDILFNNAGMNIRKPFPDYTEAEFDRIVSVHLKGMFFMAQAVYPAMVALGQGCIINVASQRGLKGAVNAAPYSAAKA